MRRTVVIALALPLALLATGAAAAPEALSQARRQALVRMVRNDCGACHGMHLTGGLGPALTPQALADKPIEGLVATIVVGRPGTPMPPWRAFLDEADARWIAEQLAHGFPELQPQSRGAVR
jgi:cytochrome c55X